MFTKNVGTIDRMLRIAVGCVYAQRSGLFDWRGAADHGADVALPAL